MYRRLLAIGAFALAAAGQASALTLTFDDRGNWTSQVTSLLNFDGGSQAVGTSNTIVNGGLFSTNLQINGYGIDLNDPMGLIRANAGVGQNYYNWGTGAIIRTQDKTPTNSVFARISFPTPVSAFGFSYGAGGCQSYFAGCFPGAAASITITPSGMAPVPITTTGGNGSSTSGLAFWGVVSDTQTFTFADIVINDANRYVVLDDIAQGSFNVAPPPPGPEEVAEPGTILQLLMGGGLLLFARRRFGTAANGEAV